jgi:hypothetical protein
MPKKSAPKKKARKKKSPSAEPMRSNVKTVDIKRVSNGYVVSTWTDKGEKAKIAKTKQEAKDIAANMLG